MSRARSLVAGVILAVAAAACAGSAGIDEFASPETEDDGDIATTERVVAPGVIAVGGAPLRLLDSTGEVVAAEVEELGLQPTWSRDGSRLIAAVASTPGFGVEVFDPSGAAVIGLFGGPRFSSSPFFFFSWSHDAAWVAALGPGRFGTSLSVLSHTVLAGELDTEEGLPPNWEVLEGGSVFVAWEPDGDRLVVHADGELLILEADETDETAGYRSRPLGLPGQRFYAPKWIPGTSEILYVDEATHLVRHDVDTDEIVDLGPTRGATAISVHPDGDRAVLSHTPDPTGAADEAIPAAFQRAVAATVEEADLTTGDRTPIGDGPALWAEWSPDGQRLLLATLTGDPHAEWWLWDGTELVFVAAWVPTATFLSRYMVFFDQYVEQPRLWAPDSSAFVYPAVVVDPDPVDRIHVIEARAGATPVAIGPGSVGFWSPAPPTP